ncbi:MAG: Crp/FNR family transcriptional regulator [Fibrobacteres bacterium]|nr:Crp/FNR family transcriptional regulator [Fibrobacterota bacterium]
MVPIGGSPACLVYSQTAGYRHGCIPSGIAAIRRLGRERGFAVVATEDPERIRPGFLENFTAVAFLNTSGNVLDGQGRSALQAFMERGGGFAGIHAACDTGYDWPWYETLVGAWFMSHPLQQKAVVRIEDPGHPSTRSLPTAWPRWDEWYDFKANPRGKVRVLATLDEKTYRGGKMGQDHPIVWCHENAGGRSWYTGCGHTKRSFSDPLYLGHLAGGLLYAMSLDAAGTGDPRA